MSQYLAVGHVATYNCDGSRERELSALSPYISGKGVGNGELAEVPPKAEPEMRIWVQVAYLEGDPGKHGEGVGR